MRIEADVSRGILEALVEYTAMCSPVANTLHNPVHPDLVVEKMVGSVSGRAGSMNPGTRL